MKLLPIGSRRAPLLTLLLVSLAGCVAPAGAPQADRTAIAPAPARVDALGIAVHGLHLSAHGYVLDLRYRITDPDRAAALLDSKSRIQLLDPLRGAKLGIPESPVIGPMRQTARNHVLYRDRDYFVLFVNPAHAVQAGEMVELAVNGKTMAQLRVE
jgi:hypothetical protein